MSQTLQKIREAKDTRTTSIFIQEWDVNLMLIEPVRRVIVGLQEQYLTLDQSTGAPMAGSDSEAFGMALLVEMVHDEQGNRVFESVEQAQEVLGEKSMRVQVTLVERCGELVQPPTEEDVEEAEGN